NSVSQINTAAAALKLNNPAELVRRCEQISAELKEKERQIEGLNSKLAVIRVNELLGNAKRVEGIEFVTAEFKNIGSDALRVMADALREKSSNCVAVLADVKSDGATIAVTSGAAAQQLGVQSGKLVGAVAAVAGGKGGGRPDFAMAGAKDIAKIKEALAAAESLMLNMLK
ncbi:MAG: DHHA1 domain-containing protein, partial [Oscillospiraceae bacterium]